MRESTMWATEGGPIVGKIINGKKYPFGTVSATQYEADMAALNTEISGLNAAVVACQGSLTGLSSALDTLSGQYAATVPGLSQAVSDIRVQVGEVNAALTSAVASLTASISEVNAKADTQAAAIGTLSSDLGAVTDLATGTAATAAGNSEAITGIRDAITQMRASIAENAAEINAFNAAITELTSTQNVDRATLTARIAAAENSVTALSQTVEGYNTSLSNQISGLRADMTVNSQDIAVIKNTLQIQGAAVESVENRCTAVENRMNSQEVGMATLRQQLLNSTMNLNEEIERINTDMSVLRNEISSLANVVSEFRTATEITLTQLNERVTALEGGGESLEILSFTASPSLCEYGGHENVILSWEIKGTVKEMRVNGEIVTGSSVTIPNVYEPTTFTLSVRDPAGNIQTRSVNVAFANHIFYGTSASPIADEGTVKALDFTELSEQRARTFNAQANYEYIYYAYPKRLGSSEFMVNDFKGGFEDPAIVSIDNHSDYTEDYYVYRSANILNSTFEVHVL